MMFATHGQSFNSGIVQFSYPPNSYDDVGVRQRGFGDQAMVIGYKPEIDGIGWSAADATYSIGNRAILPFLP